MSVRLFQGIVYQMREVIDRTIGVVDETLNVIACSDLGHIGQAAEGLGMDAFTQTEDENNITSDKLVIYENWTKK